LGRSRGGFGTKLHIAVDGLGNPVEFILTGGQEADINQGKALIRGHDSKAVIADKGYDGDDFVAAIEASGAAVVIPPKKNRIFKREYDRHLYKERNLAERFINRIKQYRRVATRYEKTARNFLGFVHVAAIMVLLL
jgi:transposase